MRGRATINVTLGLTRGWWIGRELFLLLLLPSIVSQQVSDDEIVLCFVLQGINATCALLFQHISILRSARLIQSLSYHLSLF